MKSLIILFCSLLSFFDTEAQGKKLYQNVSVAGRISATGSVNADSIVGPYGSFDTLFVSRANFAIMHLDTEILTPGLPLTLDSNGLVISDTVCHCSGGGGGVSNVTNGLSVSGDTIVLGGNLDRATTILKSTTKYTTGLNFDTIAGMFLGTSLQRRDVNNNTYTFFGPGDFSSVGMGKMSAGAGYLDLSNNRMALMLIDADSGKAPSISFQNQWGSGKPDTRLNLNNNEGSLYMQNGSKKYGMKADSTHTQIYGGSTTYTWPSVDGSSGSFLKTNGAGLLVWDTVTGGGGGSASPGGIEGSLQVKYNGEFWGSSILTFDSIYNKFSVGQYTGTPSGELDVPIINTQSLNFHHYGGGSNTFTFLWDESGPGQMYLPNGGGLAGQFLINQGTGGHTAWKDFEFASLDSAAIYLPGTPPNGRTFYCTDCSGDGITGRIVSYIAGAWRRLRFE